MRGSRTVLMGTQGEVPWVYLLLMEPGMRIHRVRSRSDVKCAEIQNISMDTIIRRMISIINVMNIISIMKKSDICETQKVEYK